MQLKKERTNITCGYVESTAVEFGCLKHEKHVIVLGKARLKRKRKKNNFLSQPFICLSWKWSSAIFLFCQIIQFYANTPVFQHLYKKYERDFILCQPESQSSITLIRLRKTARIMNEGGKLRIFWDISFTNS